MNPWQHVEEVVKWLDTANGNSRHEEAMRLLKVSEEVGEASQAYIGLQGQNPRKGRTHSPAGVADELCDVILAAMVSLYDFVEDPEEFFGEYIRARNERLGPLKKGD